MVKSVVGVAHSEVEAIVVAIAVTRCAEEPSLSADGELGPRLT